MDQTQLELHNIGRLQDRLLPHPLPQFSGWDLAVHYEVSNVGGGDYYDVIPMGHGHFGILIADVSGHGPAAAILTAMVRMLLHSCPITSGHQRDPFCTVEEGCSRAPHIVLMHLNRILVENSLDEQYMTMVFGVVDLASGEFQFSSAGHASPCWWQSANASLMPMPEVGGLPLGIDAEACYQSATIRLGPGDALVFCTDGVTEALDANGRMFGQERWDSAVVSSIQDSAAGMKSCLLGRFREHLGDQSVKDDVTILIMKRLAVHGEQTSELFIG